MDTESSGEEQVGEGGGGGGGNGSGNVVMVMGWKIQVIIDRTYLSSDHGE